MRVVTISLASLQFGETPLTWAACGGHESVVTSLVEKGAEIAAMANVRDGSGVVLWVQLYRRDAGAREKEA